MTSKSSVHAFVATARVLLVVQIIVGIAAAATALWATQAVFNYARAKTVAEAAQARAAKEKQAAKDAREEADVSRREATEAEAAANAARQRAEAYTLIAVRSRNVLQATSPQDFREAALELESELAELSLDGAGLLGDASEVSILALLATAQFRSDLPERSNKALASIDRAIRLNNTRLARLTQEASLAGIDYNEGIYLDKLSYVCAASPGEETVLINAIQTFPPAVKVALMGSGRIEGHYGVRSECPEAALRTIRTDLGRRTDAAEAPSRSELFRISRIFIHVETEAARPDGERVKAALDGHFRPQGVQVIGKAFRPGVRYYYPEQRTQAEEIAGRIAAAYGDDWPGAEFRTVLLRGYQGLPRDQVEVWLPPLSASPQPAPDAPPQGAPT